MSIFIGIVLTILLLAILFIGYIYINETYIESKKGKYLLNISFFIILIYSLFWIMNRYPPRHFGG